MCEVELLGVCVFLLGAPDSITMCSSASVSVFLSRRPRVGARRAAASSLVPLRARAVCVCVIQCVCYDVPGWHVVSFCFLTQYLSSEKHWSTASLRPQLLHLFLLNRTESCDQRRWTVSCCSFFLLLCLQSHRKVSVQVEGILISSGIHTELPWEDFAFLCFQRFAESEFTLFHIFWWQFILIKIECRFLTTS